MTQAVAAKGYRAASALASAVALLGVASLGCHQIFGLSEFELGEEAASSGGGNTGAGGADVGGGGGGTGGDVPEPVPAEDCCAPDTPPEGFRYVTRSEQPADQPIPACAGGQPQTLRFTEPPGPASCETCSCSAPGGGSCAIRLATGPIDCSSVSNPGTTCSPNLDGYAEAIYEEVKPSCEVTSALLADGFGTHHIACDPVPFPETMCEAGSTCLGGAANSALCILSDTPQQCPTEFPDEYQVYAGAIDTRVCTGCACNAQAGCSGGEYRYGTGASFSGCSGTTVQILPGAGCLNVGEQGFREKIADATAAPSCSAVGTASLNGEFTPDMPGTFCCRAISGSAD